MNNTHEELVKRAEEILSLTRRVAVSTLEENMAQIIRDLLTRNAELEKTVKELLQSW